MTKAEELASKTVLTDEDWDYIMTMDHVEYREYSSHKSKHEGLRKHWKDIGLLEDKNMWEHNCSIEGTHFVGKNEVCNWCGVTENNS